jgi:hypothetical protein
LSDNYRIRHISTPIPPPQPQRGWRVWSPAISLGTNERETVHENSWSSFLDREARALLRREGRPETYSSYSEALGTVEADTPFSEVWAFVTAEADRVGLERRIATLERKAADDRCETIVRRLRRENRLSQETLLDELTREV